MLTKSALVFVHLKWMFWHFFFAHGSDPMWIKLFGGKNEKKRICFFFVETVFRVRFLMLMRMWAINLHTPCLASHSYAIICYSPIFLWLLLLHKLNSRLDEMCDGWLRRCRECVMWAMWPWNVDTNSLPTLLSASQLSKWIIIICWRWCCCVCRVSFERCVF